MASSLQIKGIPGPVRGKILMKILMNNEQVKTLMNNFICCNFAKCTNAIRLLQQNFILSY